MLQTYEIDNYGDIDDQQLDFLQNTYIKHIHFQATGNDNIMIFCGTFDGGFPIAKTLQGNYDNNSNFFCYQSVHYQQFASSTTFLTIDYATDTPVLPTFTYGEVLISFFLFLIILGSVFSFIIRSFINNKIK